MKNLINVLCIILFISCSSGSSSFEKTISNFRQTDPKTGRLYDLDFKVIEMSEAQKITVADSLKILETDFYKENDKVKENYNALLSMVKKNLEKEKSSRFSSATMIDIHEKDIKKYEEMITEVESYKPDLSKYSSRIPDDILAYLVICKYSMNDLSGKNFTEKSVFYIAPDRKTIYSAKKIKE